MSLAQQIKRIRQRVWPDRDLGEAFRDLDAASVSAQDRLNRIEHRFGHTIVDFGAFPGAGDATALVEGQGGIDSTSVVEAWIAPTQTADHSADEHAIEQIEVRAQDVRKDVGFTLRARSTGTGQLSGKWRCGWRWS